MSELRLLQHPGGKRCVRCPAQISLSCGTRRYSRRAVLAGCGDLPTLAGTWPGYENPARPPTAAVRCSPRCRRGRTTQRYRASGHATQGIRKKMEFLHSCTSPRVSDYFLFNRPQNRDDQCIVQSALSHAFCAFGSSPSWTPISVPIPFTRRSHFKVSRPVAPLDIRTLIAKRPSTQCSDAAIPTSQRRSGGTSVSKNEAHVRSHAQRARS